MYKNQNIRRNNGKAPTFQCIATTNSPFFVLALRQSLWANIYQYSFSFFAEFIQQAILRESPFAGKGKIKSVKNMDYLILDISASAKQQVSPEATPSRLIIIRAYISTAALVRT